jgi:hypothetical protein
MMKAWPSALESDQTQSRVQATRHPAHPAACSAQARYLLPTSSPHHARELESIESIQPPVVASSTSANTCLHLPYLPNNRPASTACSSGSACRVALYHSFVCRRTGTIPNDCAGASLLCCCCSVEPTSPGSHKHASRRRITQLLYS